MRILLTGGSGFIGSAVVRHLMAHTAHDVLNVDCLTYAASPDSLAEVAGHPRYRHSRTDITDAAAIGALFADFRPDAVMHLAAESHVDRSIDGPSPFLQTNVIGTFTLLEAARHYWQRLRDTTENADKQKNFRFHHISTDEVFGHLQPGEAPFTEQSPYAPNSPYAATKAASDHLARAWHTTYGLPVFITNTTNNYGPWHFPEKLVPLMITKALGGQSLPVYGNGANVRDWLFVEDHAEALVHALEQGKPGETYAIGARQPRTNLQVVQTICHLLDTLRPDPAGSYSRLITHVADRPGHDFRYEIDPTHAEQALNWRAAHSFEQGLEKTVRWYLDHQEWWGNILAQRYRGQRLGTHPGQTGTHTENQSGNKTGNGA